jgi:hypothetical protein
MLYRFGSTEMFPEQHSSTWSFQSEGNYATFTFRYRPMRECILLLREEPELHTFIALLQELGLDKLGLLQPSHRRAIEATASFSSVDDESYHNSQASFATEPPSSQSAEDGTPYVDTSDGPSVGRQTLVAHSIHDIHGVIDMNTISDPDPYMPSRDHAHVPHPMTHPVGPHSVAMIPVIRDTQATLVTGPSHLGVGAWTTSHPGGHEKVIKPNTDPSGTNIVVPAFSRDWTKFARFQSSNRSAWRAQSRLEHKLARIEQWGYPRQEEVIHTPQAECRRRYDVVWASETQEIG